ncbi:hypothetical protein HDU85_006290 [Gaertneriomyces sp. JEL0708]|nr:hypothetical protein HDU85_006290 [Gaertneriomyces sp. JEL0708]
MHTKTSKAVLSPLADAVSTLIVIVSEAETEGSPMPDLSALGANVEAQIANLVKVGQSIQSMPSSDEQLKREMPVACDDVTTSAQRLVTATKDLVDDPYSPTGRSGLLDAVKGILGGTTQVLNCVDDAEVRKILFRCQALREHLNVIEAGVDPQDRTAVTSYINRLQQTSQNIVALAQATNKRVTELLYPVLQLRLKKAVNVLVKESPLLLGACKLLLMHAKDAEGVKRNCARFYEAIEEIETVLKYTTEEEGLALESLSLVGNEKRALVQEHIPAIVRALSSGQPHEVKVAIAEHAKAQKAVIMNTEDMLQGQRDPVLKQQIQDLLSEVAQAQTFVDEVVREYEREPTDPEKQRAIRHAVDHLLGRTDALQCALNRALVGQAVSAIANLADRNQPGTAVNRLDHAARNGDTDALKPALEDFRAQAEELEEIANAAIDLVAVANPHLAQELLIMRNRVRGLAEAYEHAAVTLANNPNDAAVQEHYKQIASVWEECIDELQKNLTGQEGVFKAHELVTGTKQTLGHHAAALQKAVQNRDADGARQETALVYAAAKQLLSIAKAEAANTDDAIYRQELEVEIRQVEQFLPNLTSAAQQIFEGDEDVAFDAAAAFGAVVGNLASQLGGLTSAIRKFKGGAPETLTLPVAPPPEATPKSPEIKEPIPPLDQQIDAIAEQLGDIVVVEEEKPMLLTEDEARTSPLKAAGQELKVEASNWTARENSIVHAANTMSQALLDLASYHHTLRLNRDPGAKKQFIAAAQEIMGESNNVAKASRPLVDLCTDRRLKAQLLGTLDRIQTLGQQFKIVAAVKASAPTDTDKDAQLVACANNLMSGVKGCLRDCESASLRISEDKLKDIGVKFRRQVYRAKQFGA